jgi:hypothetical protein
MEGLIKATTVLLMELLGEEPVRKALTWKVRVEIDTQLEEKDELIREMTKEERAYVTLVRGSVMALVESLEESSLREMKDLTMGQILKKLVFYKKVSSLFEELMWLVIDKNTDHKYGNLGMRKGWKLVTFKDERGE